MHALVAAVLLRTAGLDTLDADSKAQPPYRELAQAEEGATAGERHTVVGADRQRETKVLENPLKDGKGVDLLGGLQRLAAQQISAGGIGDGQRITVPAVRQHELALVVSAPKIVGVRGLGKHGALRSVAGFTASDDQTVPVQHCVNGTDGREIGSQVQPSELLA